jgi:hypothetical protein
MFALIGSFIGLTISSRTVGASVPQDFEAGDAYVSECAGFGGE